MNGRVVLMVEPFPLGGMWRKGKTIRPDLVLEHRHSGKRLIIDTKWKVVDHNRPSDDDLKQIYVYNHHWNCQSSLLLYPRSSGQSRYRGTYALPHQGAEHHCILGFCAVLKERRLNPHLAQEIIAMLD